MSNRQMSKYITEAVATASQTASRFGISNQFTDITFKNGCNAAQKLVDPVVDHYKNKKSSDCHLILTSFLRVPELNEKVGGSKTSRHCFGDASDTNISGVTQVELFNDLITGKILDKEGRPLKLIIDQCIYEGTWVHIALNSSLTKPRNEFLIAHFSNGGVTYTPTSQPIQ